MSEQDGHLADQLLDKLYTVALEPERFAELVEAWQTALNQAETETPDVSARLTALHRHAARAESVLSIAETQSTDPDALQQRLDAEPQAMLAVEASGAIAAANAAARLRYRLTEGGRLADMPLPPPALARLHDAVRRLLRDTKSDAGTPTLLRLPRDTRDSSLFVALAQWTSPSGRRLALLKTTDFIWPENLTPLVASAFNLTDAEADVVRMVVEGASVEEVARARGRSLATVRSQIRSIYDKTATRSQAEFIRMAIGLTTLQLADPAPVSPDPAFGREERLYPLPDHRRILTLGDGRLLDYADFGAPNGRPCVYFPNLFGDGWPTSLAASAAARGLRIIAPARACYGRSSPYPPGVVSYEQATFDVMALLDHLQIDRAVAVSQTIGGMFALALARAAPSRVAALVAIAPDFPHGAPDDEAAMPLFFRFMSSVILRHPELLEFALRSGAAYLRRVGWQRWLERIFRDSPADLTVIRDPAHAGLFARGHDYSSAHAHRAVLGDYQSIMPDAWQALLDLDVPLYALLGSADRNSRAQRTDRLIAAGADIRKVMAPGGGQLLMFSHPEMVLDALLDAWAVALSGQP